MFAISRRNRAIQRALAGMMIAAVLLVGFAFLGTPPAQAEYCMYRPTGATLCISGELYREVCWYCLMFGQWVYQGPCHYEMVYACC